MEKKQTAVEYLVQQLFKIHNNTTDVKEMNSESIIEQAKQMEKEQIENAYWDGGQDVPMISKQCEQYYNETYGGTE
jgi:hypothetical protein